MTSSRSAAIVRPGTSRLAPARRPIAIGALLSVAVLTAAAYSLMPPPASRFADDFERLDLTRWRYIDPHSRAWVAVRNGALEIHLVPAAKGEVAFNGVVASKLYDIRGRYWAAEVDPSGLRPLPGIEMKFRVTQNHRDNYISIEVAGGRIYFVRRFRGILNTDSLPYDPVADRWWRIRHGAGLDLVFWETSPDGRHWTQRHVDISGFPLDRVVPELYAGTFSTIPSPGIARFLTLRAGSITPRRTIRSLVGDAVRTLVGYVPRFGR